MSDAKRSFGLATAGASVAVSVLIGLSPSLAGAQSCALKVMASGDRTAIAQDNFDCLASKFATLENDRNTERQRADRLEQEIQAIQAVMRTSVVAMYRSERGGGACPPGWELFREAGGRFIVGAGQHENDDEIGKPLSRHPSFSDSPLRAVGGEEAHSLAIEEMPNHAHDFTYKPVREHGSSDFAVKSNNGDRAGISSARGTTDPAGAGAPHNNMPPYIALYFCKKEGR